MQTAPVGGREGLLPFTSTHRAFVTQRTWKYHRACGVIKISDSVPPYSAALPYNLGSTIAYNHLFFSE